MKPEKHRRGDLWVAYNVGSVSSADIPGINLEDRVGTIAALKAAGFEHVLEYSLGTPMGQAINPAIIKLRNEGQQLSPWIGLLTRGPMTLVLAFSKPGDLLYLKMLLE
jgi:hypothetical protein